jgi:hypothetical protein
MEARNSRGSFVSVSHSRFAGVLDILRYNWHFYGVSSIALLAFGALLWFRILPHEWAPIIISSTAITAFWTLSSLLVSYYVYDFKAVTRWQWIPSALSFLPQRWVNIHAGLDQSSATLAQFFPKTQHTVIDIYDPQEMSEPSIARARRLHTPPEAALPGTLDALPMASCTADTVFLLFAAHEIRNRDRRTTFMRECARLMTDSGQLLLVEHMRDWNNFVAFGPGFLHFHSRSEWLRLVRGAGLNIQREQRITPFVRFFLITKAGA